MENIDFLIKFFYFKYSQKSQKFDVKYLTLLALLISLKPKISAKTEFR